MDLLGHVLCSFVWFIAATHQKCHGKGSLSPGCSVPGFFCNYSLVVRGRTTKRSRCGRKNTGASAGWSPNSWNRASKASNTRQLAMAGLCTSGGIFTMCKISFWATLHTDRWGQDQNIECICFDTYILVDYMLIWIYLLGNPLSWIQSHRSWIFDWNLECRHGGILNSGLRKHFGGILNFAPCILENVAAFLVSVRRYTHKHIFFLCLCNTTDPNFSEPPALKISGTWFAPSGFEK